MFDKTYVQAAEPVPYEKTVTINRAPTDESIRFWDEMKEKAYRSILDTISITGNGLNLTAIVHNDMMSFAVKAHYNVVLNGDTITGLVVVDQWAHDGRQAVLAQIYKQVSLEIAVRLMELFCKTDEIKRL